MWTFIDKENYDDYINYYNLNEFYNELKLLETDNVIYLPRYFYKNYQNKNIKLYDGKESIESEKTKIKFTGKLRKNQEPVLNYLLKQYNINSQLNGILNIYPGAGKTIMSIYLASILGYKTCVIVDNTEILQQWVKAFYNFTDLTEKRIGIIQKNVFNVDRPVCIAMVQTLMSKIKSNPSKMFEIIDSGKFGLVIYDEVHSTSSSTQFAKSSLLFRTKNILGLSATPFHSGFHEILMKNTIGDIIYELKEYELKPIYKLIYYDSGINAAEYNRKMYYFKDHVRKKAFYNSIIIQSEKYFKIIVENTKVLLKQGHTIIILAFTKNQVKMISEHLDKEGIKNRMYYGDDKRELDKENEKVIVVTYSFCGKGFDFEKLSALIFGCSLAGQKSLIQTIGRILRECKNKLQPIVIDLIDMAFASLFIPEVKMKKNVVTNEFDCEIEEISYEK